jgi:hypothetical protein
MPKIQFRVSDELYEALDNKRHNKKTSFQQLGLKLFTEWLDRENENSDKTDAIQTNAENLQLTPSGVIASTSVVGNNTESSTGGIPNADWRIDAANAVLNSDHPVASVALTANIISFQLLVEQYEATREHERASRKTKGSALSEAERERQLAAAKEQLGRIRERYERLRGNNERSDKPVRGPRSA